MTERDAGGAAAQKTTLVEEGTELRGALSSKCPVVVRGSVDGEVSAPSLSVSASGAVRGTVRVTELRSEGEVAGEIDADIVVLSGRVKDATVIRARTLEVKLASSDGQLEVMFGECRLDIGDMPEKTADAGARRPEKRERASVRPQPTPANAGERRRGREPARAQPEPSTEESALDRLITPAADEPTANGVVSPEPS